MENETVIEVNVSHWTLHRPNGAPAAGRRFSWTGWWLLLDLHCRNWKLKKTGTLQRCQRLPLPPCLARSSMQAYCFQTTKMQCKHGSIEWDSVWTLDIWRTLNTTGSGVFNHDLWLVLRFTGERFTVEWSEQIGSSPPNFQPWLYTDGCCTVMLHSLGTTWEATRCQQKKWKLLPFPAVCQRHKLPPGREVPPPQAPNTPLWWEVGDRRQ